MDSAFLWRVSKRQLRIIASPKGAQGGMPIVTSTSMALKSENSSSRTMSCCLAIAHTKDYMGALIG